VRGAFGEPGSDPLLVAEGLRRALDDLSVFVGTDGWVLDGERGDLSPLLR
jgi:hypothetical protein